MTTNNLYSKQNIFIIGINSFVGQNLAEYLKKNGHVVSGTYRTSIPTQLIGFDLIQYSLNSPATDLSKKLINSPDWVIYCSHDGSYSPQALLGFFIDLENYFSSKKVRQIFISSISANENATSNYGLSKRLIESYFQKRKHYIVRPGLIIGNGGLFKNIYKRILMFPITPLIGQGLNKLELISIDDLSYSIKKIIETSPHQKYTYNLIYEPSLTLREFSKLIRNSKNKIFFPLPIPLFIFEILLLGLEFIGLKKLPINRENLKGFKANSNQSYSSDLESLGLSKENKFSKIIKDYY